MSLSEKLSGALKGTRVVEPIRASEAGQTVKVLFRATQKKAWLTVLEFLLARAQTWSAHVCQQYFMKDGKLVYGWNFILQPNDGVEMEAAVDEAVSLLQQALNIRSAPDAQLESFPLVGASPRRTANITFDPRMPGPDQGVTHKGAYPTR